MKNFPVFNGLYIKNIPMTMIEPHRNQAMANHQQTLETIASRGGLCPIELYCVLSDIPYRHLNRNEVEKIIIEQLLLFM